MGVKELGKFLKARSPSSVTQYTSLVPFRGKRFAIDANLLTTKFHYANAGKFTPGTPLGTTAKPLADHHPAAGHSHARAWYWFLEALRKHGIHPIVVFDGDTRLAAKARENERRRDARALQGARAAAEGGRGARLREVEAVFGAVSEEDRPAVVEGFRRVVEDTWGDVSGGGGEPVRPVAAPAGAEPDAAAAAAVEQQAWLARLDALLAQQHQDAPPSVDAGPDVAPVEPPPLEAASPAVAAGLDAVRRQDLEQAPPPLVQPAPDSESTASALLEPSPDAPHPSPLADPLGPDASPTEPAVEQQAFLARLDARLAQQQQDAPSSVDVGPDVAPVEPPPLEAASPAIAAGLDAVRRQDLEQAPLPLVPPAPDSESTASAPLEPSPDAPHPSPLADPLGPDASPTEPASSALSPSLSTASPTSPPLPLDVTPSPSVAAALAAARLAQSHKLTSLAGPAASHGPIVAHIVALATLFAEYRADALNPVYSRNQVRVTEDEGRFFEGLLREGTPAEAAATAAAAAAALDAASEDERALGDDKNERVLGEPAEEEEPPAPPTRDVELADIIAQSDKFFVSHTKRSDAPPRAAFREVRRLVAALGVPFLEPSPLDPHEAEGVCAALCTLGHADYVVSEDTDVAVYGAPLLRSVTVTPAGTGREAVRSMTVLDPVRLREDLGLTNEEFVDFALLCGTDFTDRVNNVGPANAYKLIVAHSTIERALAASDAGLKPALVLPDALDREEYLERIRAARTIFTGVPQLPLPLSSSTSSSAPDSSAPFSSSSTSSTTSISTSPSTFTGSLTPSPPSPTLAALLRSYGIRRSRHFSARGTASPSFAAGAASALSDDVDDDLYGENAQERELDEEDGAERGSSALGLGLGLDEWARAQEALDAALCDDGDGLGQEWDGAEADVHEEVEEGGGGLRGGELDGSLSDEFERLYL